TPAETRDRLLELMQRWHDEVFSPHEPQLLPILARDADVTRLLASSAPIEHVIERVTAGWQYVPEPGIFRVLLIPSVVTRPVVYTFDHHEVKIFAYPVSDESMMAEGEAPPPRLLRLLKALADERRLRILKRLGSGQYTLQQLATHCGMSKTLMHHQLLVLRPPGLVQTTRGARPRDGLRRH